MIIEGGLMNWILPDACGLLPDSKEISFFLSVFQNISLAGHFYNTDVHLE